MPIFLRSLFGSIAILIVSISSFGQVEKDIQWASDQLNAARDQPAEQRIAAIEQALARLRTHETDPDIRAINNVLDLQRDLWRFAPNEIGEQAKFAGESGVMPWERTKHLHTARVELLDRWSYLILTLDKARINAADAQRITEFVKYVSQALDELRDPAIIGGKTSELTRLANRLNGISKLAAAVGDPQARTLLAGLRNTIGTLDRKITGLGVTIQSPLRAIDIPAEVAAAMIDNSRRGMDESAAAMNEVALALKGDARALARFAEHAKNVETILSPGSFGSQMVDALAKRIPDRIPIVRTLTNWFNADKYMGWLVGKWKLSRGYNNSDALVVQFRVERGGVFGYIVETDSDALRKGYKPGDVVFRNYQEINEDHRDFRPGRKRAVGECLYTYYNGPKGWERGFIDNVQRPNEPLYQNHVGCLLSSYGTDRLEKID